VTGKMPSRTTESEWQTPAARTRTRICVGQEGEGQDGGQLLVPNGADSASKRRTCPSSGILRSFSTISMGLPPSWQTAALYVLGSCSDIVGE
jgi:hypothetical protein